MEDYYDGRAVGQKFIDHIKRYKSNPIIYLKCPFCGCPYIAVTFCCNTWDCTHCGRLWMDSGKELSKEQAQNRHVEFEKLREAKEAQASDDMLEDLYG